MPVRGVLAADDEIVPGVSAMNYEPYNKETASRTDRIAWVLCQIIDDDAPMRWTRYRFAAECIAGNAELLADLQALSEAKASRKG